jgi:hypothetical protein
VRTVEEFKERTAGKLHGVRCPVHGQPPRLRFEGSSLRDVSIRISACCSVAITLANQAIAKPTERAPTATSN